MKLARFTSGGGDELGAVVDDRIVPLTGLASDMLDLIVRWPALEAQARRIAAAAERSLQLADVRLKAPIARPGKIMAIGLNYADHIEETNAKKPEHQTWFAKMPNAVNGPYDDIQIPRGSTHVDYEAELVAVIGGRGRHISRSSAPDAVFGYCCGNDVTERAWQQRSSQWILGKSFDTHAPMGPWIVTADEIPDPHTLGIRCFVNGEKRQDSSTSNLVFNVWDQIELVSQVTTLDPGDCLYTGTPGGVGMAMKPPQFLKAGDRVRVEIDGLGAIEAQCVAEPS